LNLIVANQFTTQLTTEIRDAVFGNMGTIASFRIGQNDLESLGKYFQPAFEEEDLLRLPNYNTIVRTLVGGIPTSPFSMATLPSLGTPNPRLAAALKQLSAAKYGRPKAVVDEEINQRMITKGEAPPSSAQLASPTANPRLNTGSNPSRPTPAPASPPSAPGTFLDEWLTKRPSGSTSSSTAASSNSGSSGPSPNTTATPMAYPAPSRSMNNLGEPTSLVVPSPIATPVAVASPALTPANSQPAATKNISSDELEKTDVHKMASELKQMLNSSEYEAEEKLIKRKTEHVANLKEDKPSEDDTIFIDHEGTFTQSDAKET
jgi:hypothetical protein